MAAETTMSTTSSWMAEYNFDVFLCHRGSDPKHNENVKMDLAVPLYSHLQDSFNVFLDKFGLKVSIPSHGLLQALVTCDMGIIFFSQGFIDGIFNGSAPWCLLELRVLYAKQQWLYYQELQKRGTMFSKPRPKIFGIAVSPFQIDDCCEGEYATTPLPMVTHTQLKIRDFELQALKNTLAARSPKLVEFMDDPTITLDTLLTNIPFIPLNGPDSKSRMETFQEVKERLILLRELKTRVPVVRGSPAQTSQPSEQPEREEQQPALCFEAPMPQPAKTVDELQWKEDDLLLRKIEQMRLNAETLRLDFRDEFIPIVFSAAGSGDLVRLREALESYGHLIDGPNPGENFRTPLHHAARKGHVAVVEMLVRLGSKALDDPDSDGATPMHSAALNGHVPVIEALVRLGSKTVDTPDNHGCIPMHAAAFSGHVSVIETLVLLGSSAIDTPDDQGCTPLRKAAAEGHISVIEALVRLGSNAIDTPDDQGWTPMHSAASKGNAAEIEALVRLGSRAIDAPNNNGKTPMHAAAWNLHVSAIEMLVRLGSKAIDTSDIDGNTPNQMLRRLGTRPN